MSQVNLRFRLYVMMLLTVMVLGAVGFSYVENTSFTDALYFGIVTVATVGYGDIHPVTPMGKLLTVLLIVSGVGTFLGVIAGATEILIGRHEKQFRIQKLHILFGIFFSEVGTALLARFTAFDINRERLTRRRTTESKWSEKEFAALSGMLDAYGYEVDATQGDLGGLRDFLGKRGDILLRLLESPYLLEHESFTELLRAIFHLREELINREQLDNLPRTDYQHLSGDIKRAYILLVRHWLEYMRYLKELFPYLFSFAARMNPFDRKASPVVREVNERESGEARNNR